MNSLDVENVLSEMTLEEKASMCSGRDFWHTQNIDRLGIPSIMMCDGPNGLRKQIGEGDHLGINESIETVCYPTSSAMAASFDTELLTELGELLGEECQAEHVGMLLGPGVNMKRSPLCGRNFEYFSEDPYLAGKLAAAYVKGLQGKGVAACVKHFAANNQETRRMSGSSEVEERTLHEIYFPAFETAVKEGNTRSIMCAYNALNGTFCSENKELLKEILREKWGFDGFVVTDWGASKNRAKGIQAGVDLEMPGGMPGKAEMILKAVQNHELEEADLDEAVRNILNFVSFSMQNQKDGITFDREKAHKKSAEFASECAVLLKNNGILPLDKSKKTAMIGEFAESPRYQGAGSSHIHVEHPLSALECVKDAAVTYVKGYDLKSSQAEEDLLKEAVKAAEESEAAVIFAGLPEAYEVEGCDRNHLKLPENQNRLIEAVLKVQKNTVVVLHTGAPVELPWVDEAAAVLCMYLGGDSVGKASMDLLYGEKNPSGKLAETWPVKLEDNPSYLNFPGEGSKVKYQEGIFIGYRYYDKKKMAVQFPFGHGLSYTTFQHRDLKLDKAMMSDEEILTVSCKIRNTGNKFGKEAVQLYVSDCESSVQRPEKELKAFQKVALMPGEEKEVVFRLDQRSFAYYEERIHDWYVEEGSFLIQIGASSRDIRLEGEVYVTATKELPVSFTKYSTMGEVMKTSQGQRVLGEIMKNLGRNPVKEETDKPEEPGRPKETDKPEVSALGEGAEAMEEATNGMPLYSFYTFGIMSEEELEQLVENLNRTEAVSSVKKRIWKD